MIDRLRLACWAFWSVVTNPDVVAVAQQPMEELEAQLEADLQRQRLEERVAELADKLAHAEASLKTEREWHIAAIRERDELRADAAEHRRTEEALGERCTQVNTLEAAVSFERQRVRLLEEQNRALLATTKAQSRELVAQKDMLQRIDAVQHPDVLPQTSRLVAVDEAQILEPELAQAVEDAGISRLPPEGGAE